MLLIQFNMKRTHQEIFNEKVKELEAEGFDYESAWVIVDDDMTKTSLTDTRYAAE